MGILKMLHFQGNKITGVLRSTVFVFLLFLFVSPTSIADPASPFDNGLISSINALNGRASNDKALLKSIRVNNKQRRSHLKNKNIPPSANQFSPQSGLRDGEWSGGITGMVISNTDEKGNFVEPGTEFYIYDSQKRIRVFALTEAIETLLYKGGHIRIKGLIYNDRIMAEEASPEDTLDTSPDKKLAAANGEISQSDGDIGPGCESTGPQQALVIPINYLDDARNSPTTQQLDNRYFGTNNSLTEYWNEASYGRATLTGTTTEWYTLDMNSSCDFFKNYDAAIEMAAANQVNLDNINRIFIVMPAPPSGCGFSGIATIGCSIPVPNSDGTTHNASAHLNMANYMSSAKSGVGLAAHEAGHNLGLNHANAEDNGNASLVDIGIRNTPIEYGDMFDAMGSNWLLLPGHYNAIHKMAAGWLSEGEYIPTQTGTHVIEPMSTPLTGPKALRIFRGLARAPYINDDLRDIKEYLWVETRTDTGYDTNIDSQVYDGALIHLQRTLLGMPYVPLLESTLIDTTPQSTTSNVTNDDFLDAAISPGGSFYDPYAGITIDHLGADAVGNITIQVTIDADKQDSDEDGIPDTLEISRGTNPDAEDSDADSYTDWQEACYDNDCNTYQPYPNGGDLDAMTADTDADGLLDGDDINTRTDPLHPDTDLDGISDSTDSAPLNIFLPNPDGMLLTSDARFTQPTTSYTSSESLNIIVWSNLVSAAANPATFTVTGGNNRLTYPLVDQGDGSYTGKMMLSQLGYAGADVLINAHIKNNKDKYEPSQIISISGIGAVPEVTITSPESNSQFGSGSTITFSGSANDTEEEDLTAGMTWTSSIDGVIGTGASFSTDLLSDGYHLIEANCTDSDNNTGMNEINIEVGLPPINLTVTRTTIVYESTATLSWSGNTKVKSDVYRNGEVIAKVRNKQKGKTTYSENISAKSMYDYRVCDADTQVCSAVITTP